MRPIHTACSDINNKEALEDFKQDKVKVLVNVEMLTHGIDVPDVKTIFLCRPTMSDILFSQMIGRGSRRDEEKGKTSFNIVEFTDNIDKFGDQIWTVQRYFKGSEISDTEPSEKYRTTSVRIKHHQFDPTGLPVWIPNTPEVPEEIRGLWYRKNQTFGIEFEITSDSFERDISEQNWYETAELLRASLVNALGEELVAKKSYYEHHPQDKEDNVWNVVWDNTCGWEITTRILQNQEGFEEVIKVCNGITSVIEKSGLKVNYRTGTHIHVGWLGSDVDEIKRAINLAKVFEPGLGTLVSPSRLVEFSNGRYNLNIANEFCQPISTVFPMRKLRNARTIDDIWEISSDHNDRYVSFNIKPLKELHTVEVRLHNGTYEAKKILAWVSLWIQILWAAAQKDVVIENVPDREIIIPDGDIIYLADNYLPKAQQSLFIDYLKQRRQQILEKWEQFDELKPWVKFAKKWEV